jgi:hypothetical protein
LLRPLLLLLAVDNLVYDCRLICLFDVVDHRVAQDARVIAERHERQ